MHQKLQENYSFPVLYWR